MVNASFISVLFYICILSLSLWDEMGSEQWQCWREGER